MEDLETTDVVSAADGGEAQAGQLVQSEEESASESSAVIDKETGALVAQDKKTILKERALKLAQRPVGAAEDEDVLNVIEFRLAHERYAVEVDYVREVYPLKDLTPVPCTPSFVLGIMNVRGQVVSVTDAREFFDLPKNEITDLFRVLILENRDMEMGILADEVFGETKIPLSTIQSEMPSMGRIKEEYVRGVTKERLIILNADKLLLDPTIVVHQEVGD